MKKTTIRQIIITAVVATAILLAVGPVATYALDGDSTSGDERWVSQKSEIRDNARRLRLLKTQRREDVKTKLTAAKLKVCQNREENINNVMSRLSNRGTKQLEVFTKIYNRVKAYYQNNNLTAENYDELVDAADNAKAEAEDAVSTVSETRVEFRCDGTDPRGVSVLFKDSLKTQITTLKSYRTSIRNLIVAVKTANNNKVNQEENQ